MHLALARDVVRGPEKCCPTERFDFAVPAPRNEKLFLLEQFTAFSRRRCIGENPDSHASERFRPRN